MAKPKELPQAAELIPLSKSLSKANVGSRSLSPHETTRADAVKINKYLYIFFILLKF